MWAFHVTWYIIIFKIRFLSTCIFFKLVPWRNNFYLLSTRHRLTLYHTSSVMSWGFFWKSLNLWICHSRTHHSWQQWSYCVDKTFYRLVIPMIYLWGRTMIHLPRIIEYYEIHPLNGNQKKFLVQSLISSGRTMWNDGELLPWGSKTEVH